jgi:3-oxoacyl-[acyl-carrier protein] reductase
MMNTPVVPFADIRAIEVGAEATCRLTVSVADVEAFARLSHDTNPLHIDSTVARGYGFSRPVAHGMLALSAISRLIGTELPGPGSLWVSQELQFIGPVLVGDRLKASVRVEQVSKSAGIVALRTEVSNEESGAAVLTGKAKVKILERRQESATETSAVRDRVAVVTGGSRGLGEAIALGLGRAGLKVVVHFHERREASDAVVEAITRAGGEATPCQADLRDPGQYQRFFDEARAAFGRIDVLVNNATPLIERRPAQEWCWEDFLPYLHVYVGSTFTLSKLAIPDMKARNYGRIINVLGASACGVPPPRLAPYITAKSALAGLSRALAVELGPFGITVNTVAPSMLVTDQSAGVGDRARLLAASQNPMRRLAEVGDVAGVVAFLASDAACYITGATIPVSGGEVMP